VDLFNGSPSHDATQSVTVKQTFLVMKPWKGKPPANAHFINLEALNYLQLNCVDL
jgi:hypothetical protein